MKIGSNVIVRSNMAGVFFGKLKSIKGNVVTLTDVIRIWYWDGAGSLSQLAATGTSKPENCKFGMPIKETVIFDVIEIGVATEEAATSIQGVKPWKA